MTEGPRALQGEAPRQPTHGAGYSRTAAAVGGLLLLAGCAQQAQQWSQNPVRISCRGEVQSVIIGTVGPSAGLNASVTTKCSSTGAYIEIGPPPSVP